MVLYWVLILVLYLGTGGFSFVSMPFSKSQFVFSFERNWENVLFVRKVHLRLLSYGRNGILGLKFVRTFDPSKRSFSFSEKDYRKGCNSETSSWLCLIEDHQLGRLSPHRECYRGKSTP